MRTKILATIAGGLIALALISPACAASDQALRDSVTRSLAVLQKSQTVFERQAVCASCHTQIQPLEATLVAAEKHVPFDQAIFQRQLATVVQTVSLRRDAALTHGVAGGAQVVVSSLMRGMIAAHAPADENTDAAVIQLLGKQTPAGNWLTVGVRFPSGTNVFGVTADSAHAVDVYAPAAFRADASGSVAKARAWLIANKAPKSDTDAVLNRLKGLVWTRAAASAIKQAQNDLIAMQRADGGWAQTSALQTDPYATADVLVALHIAGMSAQDPIYQRGVEYLLRTQKADGSWYVKSRSLPIQPPIEGGFPYGADQWISAWSTALAATALGYAIS